MAKSKSKTFFVCQNCGAQRPKWEGRCSECGAWNSLVEEIFKAEPQTRGWAVGKSSGPGSGSVSLKQSILSLDKNIEAKSIARWTTKIAELDRVLGGGLVEGSFVLLGGSPGIGKSTLLMQMAGGLAIQETSVLYLSGEESVSQTGLRAQRLGVKSPHVKVAAESNLETIIDLVKSERPQVLILDSIQTVFLPDLPAAPGSVSQVRECAGHLMGLAKQENISIVLVGHVTKDGNIAGPKVLEHMVDAVLSFEGDLSHQFRLLRCLKNRFGATNELGVFQMQGAGLSEVANPSELFLEERGSSLIGSAVFAAIEGTRPLLCEVQALTVASHLSMPRRTAIGIELNRVQLLAAVLERHAGLKLSQFDVFINVVGGLRLEDPSSDLAVAAAIISTQKQVELDAKSVFFGEIGLTGEVRAVTFSENRLKEAEKLGFKKFFLPISNKKHLAQNQFGSDVKLIWIQSVQQLVSKLI